jgi:hypothetical protein
MRFLGSLILFLVTLPVRAEPPADVVAWPPALMLKGPGAAWSLLVEARGANGRVEDRTTSAQFRSANSAIADVDANGLVRARADGTTVIHIQTSGRTIQVPVTVMGTREPRRYDFANDITPILGRFGCNASGCHGKAEGQNGFRLSVFGFDPRADFDALVKEHRGRRVLPGAASQSLLLRKASGSIAHGGGIRFRERSDAYETVRGWIEAGTPFEDAGAATLTGIRIEPRERTMAFRSRQQLRVVARYSNGVESDVTRFARFQSNNEGLSGVSPNGVVTIGEAPGDVAIMATILGEVDTFRAIIPRPEPLRNATAHAKFNFIDRLVDDKLARLNIEPSEPCDDATFLRRVHLDLIGTLPSANEARVFLSDSGRDKRARLVEALLARAEFADVWALRWADLLRVDRKLLGHERAFAYYRWIRESIVRNTPLDQFARDLVTAEGPLAEVGPANFYRAVPKPGEAASSLAQVLLGVRIACAECHHHPFDRWSSTDYYGMQAFFVPLTVRGAAGFETLLADGKPVTKNSRTGETIAAHALGSPRPAAEPIGDQRRALADWMTAPDNPYFARNFANRIWAYLLGRGLVEPVDDVRATNPPSNSALLDALAKHLVASRYDLRQMIRTITASRVYQTSSKPNATNERDEQNYSRALLKRIDAEVLLDMVCQTTGVAEKFSGSPAGTRAIQLWDSKVGHYFLKQFGRPERGSSCECERRHEPSVAQVLHLLNAPEIQAKLSHEAGTVARLVRTQRDDAALIEELYLIFFSRFPNAEERRIANDYLAGRRSSRQRAVEDLAWVLLNAIEFRFNH